MIIERNITCFSFAHVVEEEATGLESRMKTFYLE